MTTAIRALHLGNFKAFANTQRIPLRPLTLIYGPNSSGKSSIIHSLLLARHALETGELDAYSTNIGGDAIDLGGFGQYVYKRDRANRVEWAVELDPRQFKGSLGELLRPVQSLMVSITIGRWQDGEQDDEQVGVESFSIEADQDEVIYMSRRRKSNLLWCNRLNYDHPLLNQIIEAVAETQTTTQGLTPADRDIINRTIDDVALHITSQVSNWLPQNLQVVLEEDATDLENRTKQVSIAKFVEDLNALGPDFTRMASLGNFGLLAVERMLPIGSGERQTELPNIVTFWLIRRLQDLIQGISKVIDTDFMRFRYLGPFRSYPPRHFGAARQQDSNWDAGGGAAWQTLLTNARVREKVNYWLADPARMKTPYELVLRDLIPGSDLRVELLPLINQGFQKLAVQLIAHVASFGGEVQAELERLMGDIESLSAPNRPAHTLPEIEELVSILADTEGVSEEWVKKLAASSSERTVDLVLVDQRSQTPVSHRDVGIGVSQVLPILVSCYALENSNVAIEQPEIHLHPRLQAELADVFIESTLGDQKNMFILETHSEHLLLRIMRRMRETYSGDLPKGCPPVRPEDIAVLYVDPVGSESIVQEMPLNKRGELVKAWPGGFFEEGLEEVFA